MTVHEFRAAEVALARLIAVAYVADHPDLSVRNSGGSIIGGDQTRATTPCGTDFVNLNSGEPDAITD